MLILTRRRGEKILINKGQIEVLIINNYRGRVALGIKAPAGVDVDREEIFIRKRSNPTKDLL